MGSVVDRGSGGEGFCWSEVALVVTMLVASFIGEDSGCDNGYFFRWLRWLVAVSFFISFVGGGGSGYDNGFFGLGRGGISARWRHLSPEVAASPSDMGGEVSDYADFLFQ